MAKAITVTRIGVVGGTVYNVGNYVLDAAIADAVVAAGLATVTQADVADDINLATPEALLNAMGDTPSLVIVSASVTTKPSAPNEKDVYIVPAGSAWAALAEAYDNQLALFERGGWKYITPKFGWQVRNKADNGVLWFDGDSWEVTGSGGGSGTVTSVGLSLPSIFSVSGSPVTVSGTLTAALANQTANLVFAGPTSDGAAAPTFRTLVANDYVTMIGDSGAGGTKGAVPAPAAGDAAANKFLKADGAWTAIPSAPVTSVFGRTGAVVATVGDYSFSQISGSVADGQLSVNVTLLGNTVTGTGAIVRTTSPTLVTPTIASFANANHSHADAAGGGQLNATNTFNAGTIPVARLPLLVGDSGAGGTAGLAPAPAAGDAAANKFLKADGTWAVAGSSSGANPTVSVGLAAVNGVAVTFMRSDAAPALDQAITPTWTGAHVWNGVTGTFRRNAIGVTSTDGLILENTTAAAVGAQQFSPRLRLTGQGRATTPNNSQTLDWIIENQPVQGATNPTSDLVFLSQINAGGYVERARFQQPTAAGITGLYLNNPGNGSYNLQIRQNLTSSASFEIVTTNSNFAGLAIHAGNGHITVGNGGVLSFSTSMGIGDATLRRSAAANLAFGAADAAAASVVAQTISVQNVVGGSTNGAGQQFTVRGSLGTSQGVPGRIHIQAGALIAASGTTQQTAVDRQIFGASKVLTNNTVTTVCNVTVASNTAACGIVDYTVEVFDGTDVQIETGQFIYQVTNKGGVIANNTITSPTGFPKNVATAGTLAVTWSISAANPALLQINANSSLTPSTGYPRVTYSLRNLTQQAVAIQ